MSRDDLGSSREREHRGTLFVLLQRTSPVLPAAINMGVMDFC